MQWKCRSLNPGKNTKNQVLKMAWRRWRGGWKQLVGVGISLYRQVMRRRLWFGDCSLEAWLGWEAEHPRLKELQSMLSVKESDEMVSRAPANGKTTPVLKRGSTDRITPTASISPNMVQSAHTSLAALWRGVRPISSGGHLQTDLGSVHEETASVNVCVSL